MKKKCNVTMLPAEKAIPSVVIPQIHTRVMSTLRYGLMESDFGGHAQHLYITSNGEIKKDDIMYDPSLYEIAINIGQGVGGYKIIASTDKSLGLPGIPESFIKKFVEEDGKIDEIFVEFEGKYFTEEDGENSIKSYRPKIYNDVIQISHNEKN